MQAKPNRQFKDDGLGPFSDKPHAEMSEAERDRAALHEVQADIDGSAPLGVLAGRTVPMIDVRALRARLGMTQKGFSEHFGFALAAVRNWEQRRRLPDRSARILLRVIADDPQRVERIIKDAY